MGFSPRSTVARRAYQILEPQYPDDAPGAAWLPSDSIPRSRKAAVSVEDHGAGGPEEPPTSMTSALNSFLYRRLCSWITCDLRLPFGSRVALSTKYDIASAQDVFC